MPETAAVQTPVEQERIKKTSRFVSIIKYLLSDAKSVVGMIIVLIFVVIAIIGPSIAPYAPNALSAHIFWKPFSPGHLSARTTWAATYSAVFWSAPATPSFWALWPR